MLQRTMLLKQLEVKQFITRQGLRLTYRHSPAPGRPVLCLVYGLASSAFHFIHQWEYFQGKFEIIQLNYQGHHESEMPNSFEDLTLEHCSQDIFELIHYLKIKEKVHFFGHSMGVNIALECFAHNREGVGSLILMGGVADFPWSLPWKISKPGTIPGGLKRLAKSLPTAVTDIIWKAPADNIISDYIAARVGFNPALAAKEDVHGVVSGMGNLSPHIFLHMFWLYSRHDRNLLLKEIDVPVLAIAGEKDRLISMKKYQEFFRKIPSARLVTMPEGSHCPQFDQPQVVNREVEEFLRSI